MADKKSTKKTDSTKNSAKKVTKSQTTQEAKKEKDVKSSNSSNKIISLLKKKKVFIPLIAVLAVVIGGSWYLANRKIDLTSEMHPVFKGHEGSGSVYLDGENGSLSGLIKKTLAKKAGLNNVQTMEFVDSSSSSNSSFITPQDMQKYNMVKTWYDEITVNTKGTDEMKNGDKITVTVDNGGDSTNPIKSSKRTFTVKGLKKVKEVKTKEFLKDIKVSFVGVNGIGRVVITSDNDFFDQQTITVKNNGRLKNGDTAVIDLTSILQNSTKKIYSGSKILKVKVKGLMDISEISNLQELKDKFNIMANNEKEDYDSITNLSFDSLRIVPSISENDDDSSDFGYDSYDYDYSSSSKSKKDYESEVTINDENNTDSDVFITFKAYYKVSYKDASGRDPYYRFKAPGLKLNGKELDLSGVDTDSSSYGTSTGKPTDASGYLA